MAIRLQSPYGESTAWLRGNLHAHTTRSDGTHSPQGLIDTYAALGYDFLAITDHDMLADLSGLDARGMVLIRGNEVTAIGPHIVHLGAAELVAPSRDRQAVFDGVARAGGLAVVNHPNWEKSFDHCSFANLMAWQGYHGIEILNGVAIRMAGNALATDKWDRLLGEGRRAWAFANDDTHEPCDVGNAWNMVQAAERTPEAILDALRAGRFYPSTGVAIEAITVRDTRIHVLAPGAQRMVAIADYGQRIQVADAPEITLDLPGDTAFRYVRFECFGPGEARAWTQPVFIERA